MEYKTRRQQRLEAERQRQIDLRSRVYAFIRTVMALVVFASVAIFIGTRGDNMQLSLFSPGKLIKADTNKQSSDDSQANKTNAAEAVTSNLPVKISQFNQELQIDNRTNLGDLPSQTTTAVVTIDLVGKGRGNVNYNGDVQFTSASTYKIYVAYAMIHDVETGTRSWNSRINGTTWEQCLNRMIINSDNGCPEVYINSSAMGYPKFNQLIHDELGVSSKTQMEPYNMRTTASDLAAVLQKLYQGKLMTEDNKNRLLSLMQQQIYRQGIPAGVGTSATVADKVGFLDNLLHDAAIVSSTRGDYVMVIMTNGESWPFIAKVAGYVHSEMTK